MFDDAAELFGWRETPSDDETVAVVEPWKPHALTTDQWPPNYTAVELWRIRTLHLLRSDPKALAGAKAYYAKRPAEFIMHWMFTYDPRKTDRKWMPFVFFYRQLEFITFLQGCVSDGQSGLVEKCRDAGATWLSCGFSVHQWLFNEGVAIGWGSRKEELVDKIGNPDSIFEKMRLIIRRLPPEFRPSGWNPKEHSTFRRLINPENGSVIMGEAGDNIGRGGRTTMYFKDESAHYERAELVEAALGDNTNVQIDISSVNGLGNVFHRRREAGIVWQPNAPPVEPGYTRVFIIDWRDHPAKTQEWYDTRRAKYEREGMLHVFAQEVDRNYSAAVQNTIIPYEWIAACVDAHKKFRWRDNTGKLHTGVADEFIPNKWIAGLDVADEGMDRNALALRQWVIWRSAEEWGERDPGVTTRRAIAACRQHRGIKVMYDSIGIGSNVKSEFNRLTQDEKIIRPEDIKFIPWNAGGKVLNPYDRIIPNDEQSLTNDDFFKNIKAQAWWSVRTRCYKTFMNVMHDAIYPLDELISLDGSMPLLHQVMKELAQPTRGESAGLKTIVNKKPNGTKSPNLADAGIMQFFPIEDEQGYAITGSYSG